uniref:Probable oligoribonuclease n=1 Tax=Pristionchus pacificus TaxID=54126 RepID=A0A8R1V3A8_PRIPA
MTEKADRIVWVDCEMTGLEADKGQTLVEIAVIVTDAELNIVAEGPDIVIHQDEETLSKMSTWCKETFEKNGLTERIRASKVGMAEAEQQVLSFLREHVVKDKSPLAGNTIYMDRIFIKKYMPKVDDYLHYRLIDVSSVKELSRRWYPAALASAPPKAMTHRALDDIRESIAELKHYRANVFK